MEQLFVPQILVVMGNVLLLNFQITTKFFQSPSSSHYNPKHYKKTIGLLSSSWAMVSNFTKEMQQ
jgi:hypothetical protein